MLEEIENPGPPLSEAEVAKFCSETGLRLPSDYRAFLLRYNGGRPIPDTCPVIGHEEKLMPLQVFYGIGREIEVDCLKWNYEVLKDRIPDFYLPIAGSDCDDQYCLVLSGDHFGSVVFWDYVGERGKDNLENIYEIADSFTEFLEIIIEY